MEHERILKVLRIVLAGITAVSVGVLLFRQIADTDFFWHLTTGRWIVEHRVLPTQDPFNYTTPEVPDTRVRFTLTYAWLSQILYYGIYYLSGWNGFIFTRFIILGIIIYFMYQRAGNADRTILVSVIAITATVFVQMYPLERPQVFSFLFFSILLYLLEKVKTEVEAKKKLNLNLSLFFLPLLMLLWANMHGGYIVGQGTIVIYLLSEAVKFLHPSLHPMERSAYRGFLLIGIAGILSALVNPDTYKAIIYVWTMPELSFNLEYWSTIDFFKKYFSYNYSIPAYWLLLLTSAVCLTYRVAKKRFEMADIIMLAGLGYFSFTQLRYVAFFLVWAAPFISLSLTSMIQGPGIPVQPPHTGKNVRRSLSLYVSLLLSAFLVVALTLSIGEFRNLRNITNFGNGRWVHDFYPAEAVNFIRANNIRGNMYNYFEWGGYLMWRFYPEKKVFADGREFTATQFFDFIHIFNTAVEPQVQGMPRYKGLLDAHRIRYMVLPLYTVWGDVPPIVGEMLGDKEWIAVFFSGNSLVFVKDTFENHDLVLKYSIPKDALVAELFKALDDRIRTSPGDFSLYLAKGDLYLYRQKFRDAQREYRKVLEINPFNSAARERLEFLNISFHSEKNATHQ